MERLPYLSFDLEEVAEGLCTLEAMASTPAVRHEAVMADARRVLDWAWREFAQGHGSADDGMDWDHELQVSVEPGGWHTVTLTLTASPRFVEAFLAAFGSASD